MKLLVDKLNLDEDTKDICMAAALLHDVGYAPSLNVHDFHPVDGYMAIKSLFPCEISLPVLYHSFADLECNFRRPDMEIHYDDKMDAKASKVWELLTYCDLHTDGQGNLVTVDERYADIKLRHGADSIVYAYMQSIRGHVDNLVTRVGSYFM